MDVSTANYAVRKHLVVFLISALLLPACRAVDTQEVDWEHGAKRAIAEKMYSPQDLRADDIPSCLKNIPESERLSGRYVQVSHWQGRWRQWKPAKVTEGLVIKAGDEVEIQPIACDSKSLPVVKKVLQRSGS